MFYITQWVARSLALSRFSRIKLNIMAVTAENLHDDKGPKILAVLWTLTGLTTVIVIARVYIRLKLLRNFGVDDYLIVASIVRNLELFFYLGESNWGLYARYWGLHTAESLQQG